MQGERGATGPTGHTGATGKSGTVANNFSQYLIKIVNGSNIPPSYTTLNSDTYNIGGYALIYSTDDNLSISQLEIFGNSGAGTPEFGVRVSTGNGISSIRLTSQGVGSGVPLSVSAGSSNSIVLYFSSLSVYDQQVASQNVFYLTIRWSG